IETAVTLLTGYAADQDLDAARAHAADIAQREADDAQVAMGVALFHQAIGEGEQGRAQLRRSLQLDDAFTPARLMLAGLELAAANDEQARVQYRAVLSREPRNVQALLGLAQVATQAGAVDEAATHLQAAIAADPDNATPRLALARLELGRDDVAAARRVIDEAAARHPGDPEIATLQGLVRFREGRGEAAVDAFRRATDGDPERVERWLNLARAQAGAGDQSGARASALRARALQPNAPPVLQTLAQIELELGNLDAARTAARALQSAAPRQSQGFQIEGDVSARERDWRDADRLYVAAYEREPAFATAFRSYQARRQGDIAEPAALLARWVQATPNDTRARLIVAQQLQEAGQYPAAVREYEAIISRDADNVVALNNAAWLLGEQGEYVRALDYARRALGVAPEVAPVLDTYGWILVQSGRVNEGLGYLEQAVARAPAAPDLRFHLGSAQVTAGQAQAARETLTQLLAQNPDYARRDEAQRLLDGL
ncbi:MAG: tetratricopeptide repeat protein, partial [Gammaproteobacteria bacterium]|nr:tetratricopeptide repeat protein [Gammaproteobacteria bacterium]